MKILHITSSLDGGGIARLLYDYCTRMIPDISFDFAITSETKGMLEDELMSYGCKIYRIPQVRKGILKHCRSLSEIMQNGQYDIIHDHSDYRSLFSLIVAKKIGINYRIVHSHLAFVPESNLKKIERKVITKFIIHLSTHLMACGEDAAKWMWGEKTFDSGKVIIMKNAIITEQFLFNNKKRIKLRNELGLENKFVIGNVARFTYQKNHDFLLDIFNETLKRKPNACLLLIGDGELRKDIVSKAERLNIRDKIVFLGTINNVPDYLNVMDVFVLPSRFEGLGIVYVEAQANGLRCFATKDVVPNEANICNMITYLSKDKSAKEWSNEICRCNTDHVKNAEKNIIESGYDINLAVKEIKNFYISLKDGE